MPLHDLDNIISLFHEQVFDFDQDCKLDKHTNIP